MERPQLKKSLALLALVSLAACGGGGAGARPRCYRRTAELRRANRIL